MYAEERQQAIADLVAQRGRLSVIALATEYDVTTETVRRDLSALERPDRSAGCTAAPYRPAPSPLSSRPPRPRPRARREKDRIAGGRARPAARERRQRAARRGHHHARLAGRLPRDRELTVVTNAVPIAARLAGSPHVDLHLLPGRVRPTTHAAVGEDTVEALAGLRADVAFVGTNGLSVGHGLSTPDHDEAAAKRAIVASRPPGRRARRLRARSGTRARSASPRLGDIDVVVTDSGIERADRDGLRLRRPRGGGRMIVTLTPNPSIDRTVALAEPLVRGAVQRRRSGLPGGRQGRQHLPRRRRRRRADDRRAARALRTTRSSSRAARGRHRLPPGAARPATSASTSRSPSPTAPPPRSTPPAPRPPPTSLAALGPPARPRRDAAWVVLAGSLPPGAPDGWYADLVARPAPSPRAASRSTPRGAAVALAAGLAQSPARPDEAQRRGAGLPDRRGRRRHRGRPGRGRRAAAALVAAGVEAVLATLGGSGAVLVTADGAWHATPPPTTVVSTVGAGDSSLFGYLLGDLRGRARRAAASRRGLRQCRRRPPGTTDPHPRDIRPDLVDAVTVRCSLDSTRELRNDDRHGTER